MPKRFRRSMAAALAAVMMVSSMPVSAGELRTNVDETMEAEIIAEEGDSLEELPADVLNEDIVSDETTDEVTSAEENTAVLESVEEEPETGAGEELYLQEDIRWEELVDESTAGDSDEQIDPALAVLDFAEIEDSVELFLDMGDSDDSQESWELIYNYENDDHTVLVGEEKRITTDTYHLKKYIGNDGQLTERAGHESLYSVAIAKDEEGNALYDKDKIEVSVAEDQKTILVKGTARGEATFQVALMVPTDPGDEDSEKKEVLRHTFRIVVSNDYTYITPQPLDMPELVPEEPTAFKPQLIHVYTDTDGTVKREACENARVTLTWDDNNLSITYKNDAGAVTELSSGDACTATEYTITRKTDSDTYLTVNMEWDRNGFGYDPYGTKTYEIDRYVAPNYSLDFMKSGGPADNYSRSYAGSGSPSWIYADETDFTAFFNLNQIINRKDYSLEVQIGDYAEDGSFTEYVENPIGNGIISTKLDSADLRVTVNGKELVDDGYLSMSDRNHFRLRVQAVKPGADGQTETIAEAAAEVNLREPSAFYGLDCNEQNILKGWNWEYPTYFSSNLETAASPFGGEYPTEVRNVQILDRDNNEKDVLIIEDRDNERECGYIQANAFGTATVAFTVYIDALNIETTLTKTFHVTDTVWNFEPRYQDNTDRMIQNSEKRIATALKHVYFEEMEWGGSEERWEDAECKLEVIAGSYNSDLIDVKIDQDGTTLLVTSGEETGDTDIGLIVKAKDESGNWVEATRGNCHICVTDEYYYITPFDYEFEMIYPGDSKEVELKLMHAYTDVFGDSQVEQCEEVQYTWDWDRDYDLEQGEYSNPIKVSYVNDDDMEVDLELPNSPEYWDLNCSFANKYTITRNDNTNTGIRISAAVYNGLGYEQVADINYQLNTFNAPYYDIDVEDICKDPEAEGEESGSRRNEAGDTYLYTDETELYAVINAEQLYAECDDVAWSFAFGNYTDDEGSFEVYLDNDAVMDVIEYQENDDRLIIKLDGTKLAGFIEEDDERWMRLKISGHKQYGSETYTVAERDFGISVRNPSIDISVDTSTKYMLPGWKYEIWPETGMEINNAQYPDRQYVNACITEVNVESTCEHCIEHIVELERREDRWVLYAKHNGSVKCEYKIVDENGIFTTSVTKEFNVCSDIWDLDLNYQYGTCQMTSTDEMVIDTCLHHGFRSDDGDEQWEEPEYKLEVVEDSYDSEHFDVQVSEDTLLNITSKGSCGSADIEVIVMIKKEDEEYEECCRKTVHVEATDSFYYLIANADEEGVLAPGESEEITLELNHAYSAEDGSKQTELCKDARFRWEWDRDWEEDIDPVSISYQNKDKETVILEMPTDQNDPDSNVSNADKYTLTRLKNWDMDFRVIAEVPNADGGRYEEVIRKDYHMDEFRAPNYEIFVEDVCKDTTAEEEARGSRRNEDGDTWVFTNESDLSAVINIEELSKGCDDYNLIWELGDYVDDEGAFETYLGSEAVMELLGVQEDSNGRLIAKIDGTKLAGERAIVDENGEGRVCLRVRAEEKIGSETYEVGCADIGIEICNPCYGYYFALDDSGENELLPGWVRDFNNDSVELFAEDAEHPFGEDVELQISSAAIVEETNINEEGNAVIRLEQDQNDDNNRWVITALDYGCATIKVNVEDLSGTYKHTFETKLIVSGDVYDVQLWSEEEKYQLLPGEPLTLQSQLWHHWYDRDGHHEGKENNVVYTWSTDRDDIVTLEKAARDGSKMTVTAKNDCDNYENVIVSVEIKVYDSEQSDYVSIGRNEYGIEVIYGYYTVYPESSKINSQLAVGSSTTINPRLTYSVKKEDSDDEEPEIDMEDSEADMEDTEADSEETEVDAQLVRYSLSWDPRAVRVTVKDDKKNDLELGWTRVKDEQGNETKEETLCIVTRDSEGNITETPTTWDQVRAPFTITRLKNWGTDFYLGAEIKNEKGEYEEVAGRSYQLDDGWYGIDLKNARDDDWTWIYANEDYVPEVSIELPEGADEKQYTLNWSLFLRDEEDEEFDEQPIPSENEVDPGILTVKKDASGNSVPTLHGDKLFAYYQALNKDLDEGWESSKYVLLRVELTYDGEVLGDRDYCLRAFEERYEYYYPMDAYMSQLVGWEKYIETTFDCYAENSEYPFGENIQIKVTNVTAVDLEDPENPEDPNAEPTVRTTSEVCTVEAKTDDAGQAAGWLVTMAKPGHARIKIEYTDAAKELQTFVSDVWVGGEVGYLYLTNESGSNTLAPGAEMTIGTRVELETYDAERSEEEGGAYSKEDISKDVIVVWKVREDERQDVVSFKDAAELTNDEKEAMDGTVKGSPITIKALEDGIGASTCVAARAYKIVEDGEDSRYEEVTYSEIWIDVSNQYWKILPIASDISLEVGETTEIEPKAEWHEMIYSGEGDEQTGTEETSFKTEEISFQINADPANVSIFDTRGNQVDTTEGTHYAAGETYMLKRVGNEETRVEIIAFEANSKRKYEIGRTELYLSEVEACEHDLTHVEAATVTCTTDGIAEHYLCSVCGRYFRDKAAENEVEKPEKLVTKATGHKWNEENEITIEATASKSGMIYYACSQCDAKKVLTIIPPSGSDDGSSDQKVEEIKIDTLQENLDKYDKDADAALPVTELVKVIAEIDNEALASKAEEDSEIGEDAATKIIENAENVILQKTAENPDTPTIEKTEIAAFGAGDPSKISIVGAAITAAAATADGERFDDNSNPKPDETYKAEFQVARDEEEDAKHVNTFTVDLSLNILDSNDNVVKENAELAAPVTITLPVPKNLQNTEFVLIHKKKDGDSVVVPYSYDSVNQTITFIATGFSPYGMHNHEDPAIFHYQYNNDATCTDDGTETGTCEHDGCTATDTRVSEEHKKTGHKMTATAAKAATCTAAGNNAYWTCGTCKKVYPNEAGTKGTETTVAAQTIPAKGHNEATDAAAAATCTMDGKTAGSHCFVCGTVIVAQETVAATGNHDYGDWKVGEAATALKAGTQTRTCKTCGKTETNTLPKLNATIKLSKTKVSLKKGKSVTIKVTKLALGDKVMSWKTSNKKVATVSKTGKIKAKKKGKATITVILQSGLKKTIKVTVK